MNTKTDIKLFKHIVLGCVLGVVCWPLRCFAYQVDSRHPYAIKPVRLRADRRDEFENQCRVIVDHLGGGNLKMIIRDASKDGIIIVRRETDQPRNFRPIQESQSDQRSTDYLSLQGLRPHAILELNTKFNRDLLAGDEFRRVVKQFERFITISKSSPAYRPTLYRSLYLEKYGTYLSYVAEGKLVSGVFWHIYFAKEGRQWKITRLEYSGR